MRRHYTHLMPAPDSPFRVIAFHSVQYAYAIAHYRDFKTFKIYKLTKMQEFKVKDARGNW